MKQIFSFFAALCLLFCGMLPAFATETSTELHAKIQLTTKDRNGTPLVGAVYGLYSFYGSLIQELTTDSHGTAISEDVPAKFDYYLEEITPPNGFQPNKERHELQLANMIAPSIVDVCVVYDSIMGRVKIIKVDEVGNPLSGVGFQIYRQLLTEMVYDITTGTDGTATSGELIPGDYYLVETIGKPGYTMGTGQIPFTIDDTGATVEKTVVNAKIPIFGAVEVTHQDDVEAQISGTKFGIFSGTDNLVEELITDKNGVATSGTLNEGGYYLRELEIPEGYLPNAEKHPFSITESNGIVPVTVTNQRISGSVKVVKKGGGGELLPGVKFRIYSAKTDVEMELITTNWEGIATSNTLYYGNYYLKELETAEGYELVDMPIPFAISQHGVELEIPVTNSMILGGVKLITLSGEKPEAGNLTAATPLPGAVFGIYNAQGHKLAEVTTDRNGCAEYGNLPKGEYVLREMSAPDGHILIDKQITFSIQSQGQIFETTVYNPKGLGTIEVKKRDDDSKKLLLGASFAICRVSDGSKVSEVVTGADGTGMSQEIPAGDYYLLELRAPEGFELSEKKHPATVTAGEVTEITITNKRLPDELEKLGILELTKEDKETGKALKGAVFTVYTRDNEKIDEVTTDRDGIAELELPVGNYYLRELEAPSGYQLDRGKVEFKISEGKTTRLIVENIKEKFDPVKPETHKPEQPKPQTPESEQPKPSPTPAPSHSENPAPTQPKNSEPSGSIRLVKLAAGSGTPLPGAVFGIYSQTGEKLTELTTCADGTATFSLPIGRYILKELRAPYGYKLENAQISAEVLQNKTTLVEVTNELDPNAPPMPEINVPQTGISFPTLNYAVAAILFGIALSCVVILIRSRRQKN